MNNTRQHEVFNRYGDIVKVLHRGDHESTRYWFKRCEAADKAALAEDKS